MKIHGGGRVLLVSCRAPIDGEGLSPDQIRARATASGTRYVLIDATRAPYVDSEGLRWLLHLRAALEALGIGLRVAARREGPVWRNLTLLRADLDLQESVRTAWQRPWKAHSCRQQAA